MKTGNLQQVMKTLVFSPWVTTHLRFPLNAASSRVLPKVIPIIVVSTCVLTTRVGVFLLRCRIDPASQELMKCSLVRKFIQSISGSCHLWNPSTGDPRGWLLMIPVRDLRSAFIIDHDVKRIEYRILACFGICYAHFDYHCRNSNDRLVVWRKHSKYV